MPKLILYVDATVYSAIRKQAYDTEQFRSHIIESILANALGVTLSDKPKAKQEELKV